VAFVFSVLYKCSYYLLTLYLCVCTRVVVVVKTTDVENTEPDYIRDIDGVMKFRCGVCGVLFARIWHLRRHIKLHYGYKPHACPSCPKTFARAEHLRKHMLRHSSGRTFHPHVCRHCMAEFSVGRELKEHLKAQHTSPINAMNGAGKPKHKHQVRSLKTGFSRLLYLSGSLVFGSFVIVNA